MSYLLEILGKGLLGGLAGVFEFVPDDGQDESVPTATLLDAALRRPVLADVR